MQTDLAGSRLPHAQERETSLKIVLTESLAVVHPLGCFDLTVGMSIYD